MASGAYASAYENECHMLAAADACHIKESLCGAAIAYCRGMTGIGGARDHAA